MFIKFMFIIRVRERIFVIVPLRESVRVSVSISKYYCVTAKSILVTQDGLASLYIISGLYMPIR